MKRALATLLATVLLLPFVSRADEGLWTFDQFPSATTKAKYGFAPDAAWLDHVRLSAVRIAGGCSASIVSPQGLVMTNYHCVSECVSDLSAVFRRDLSRTAFLARSENDERRCDGMELDQLLETTDVTERVQRAVDDVAPDKYAAAQRAAIAAIESGCATSESLRCEVVALHRGARHMLYRYLRLQDIRLVFSPEESIAEFGGDPDNFTFPRYNLDVAFLRIYGRDGRPLPQAHWLRWSGGGPHDGELVFAAGNPGRTSRLVTIEQLDAIRDVRLVRDIARMSELRGLLLSFQERGPEQRMRANDLLNSIENWLKEYKGEQSALANPVNYARLAAADAQFRARIKADPVLNAKYGPAWDGIAAAVAADRRTRIAYDNLESGFRFNTLFQLTRRVIRYAAETSRPDNERLKDYTDARLPQLRQAFAANKPIYQELEISLLAWSLSKLVEELGADHPAVKRALGTRTPMQVATMAIRHTRMTELHVDAHGRLVGGYRKLLLDGGAAAVEASKDPMVTLVRNIEPEARAVIKARETTVDGPLAQHQSELGRARFALDGDELYPEGTSTLRLTFGTVRGYRDEELGGSQIGPFATIGGAFARHTGSPPFALPPSWLAARSRLNPDLPFNFVTDLDTIGGNSGSPVINEKAEVVGLHFDGNRQSIGHEFGFDADVMRSIDVQSASIIEALDKVYSAQRVVRELTGR